MSVTCLHGFLGQPTDWDLIQSHFMVSPFARRFEWWSVDLFKTAVLSPQWPLLEWAQHFNQKSRLKFSDSPRILVGYSMGGRLALQALQDKPDLYDAVICISTNPGLAKDKDREERRHQDLQWSQKFFKKPWADLMQEWNSQAVFSGSVSEPARLETDYEREQLSRALNNWSLSQQQDFRPLIQEHADKILWLSGQRDIKFLSMAMELKKLAPNLTTEVVGKASHRILFDNPSELAEKMIGFLAKRFL